jgi:hypothetical protein
MQCSRFDRIIIGAAAVFALGGFASGTAYGQGATISQSGGAVSTDCGGGDATLNGSGNSITFRNACRALTVNGSGNTIQIELKPAGTITLNGAGNRVSYASVAGTADAAVTEHGQGNAVMRVAALSTGPTTITGSAAAPSRTVIHGAGGQSVEIGPSGIVVSPTPGTGSAVTITPGGGTPRQ